jgi:hypothetical protein
MLWAQWHCGFVIPYGCGTATILRFPNYFIVLSIQSTLAFVHADNKHPNLIIRMHHLTQTVREADATKACPRKQEKR